MNEICHMAIHRDPSAASVGHFCPNKYQTFYLRASRGVKFPAFLCASNPLNKRRIQIIAKFIYPNTQLEITLTVSVKNHRPRTLYR